MGWDRRRVKLRLQESCYFDWQNLIADASRRGFVGQEELQWDSYQMLSEQLEQEWLEIIELRKHTRLKGNKRAPRTLEERRKISEAITAKWADPVRAYVYITQYCFVFSLVVSMCAYLTYPYCWCSFE